MERSEAFEVLGLNPDASHREMRDAYRTLKRMVHPMLGGDPFQHEVLEEAWDVLRNEPPGTRTFRASLASPAWPYFIAGIWFGITLAVEGGSGLTPGMFIYPLFEAATAIHVTGRSIRVDHEKLEVRTWSRVVLTEHIHEVAAVRATSSLEFLSPNGELVGSVRLRGWSNATLQTVADDLGADFRSERIGSAWRAGGRS